MKKIAIIGARGMVGQNLYNLYNSDNKVYSITRDNIETYNNLKFDIVFVTAADGRKYLANKEPYSDLIAIMSLLNALKFYQTDKIVLISTIDVYNTNNNIGNENTKLSFTVPNYGSNRLLLEFALDDLFKEKLLVIRLQGLIAKNLKKNLLFDIKNRRTLPNFSKETTFQFYPLNRLRNDIALILKARLKLCNLSAEPISINEIYSIANREQIKSSAKNSIVLNYNIKSIYHSLSLGNNGYWLDKNSVIFEIQNYFNIF